MAEPEKPARRTPRKPAQPRRPAAAPTTPAPAVREVPPLRETSGGGLYDALWRTGILNLGAVTGRELAAYFVSPIGYVAGAALLELTSAFGFLVPIYIGASVSPNQAYYWLNYLLMFLAPLYTMRLLSEERRTGTLEVLLTSPVRDWEAVVGKWLAAWLVFFLTSLFTLVYVVLIAHYSPVRTVIHPLGLSLEVGNVDYGGFVAVYLGTLLAGAAFMAIGVFASSLSSNQIIAAVIGVGLLVGIYYVLPAIGNFLPGAFGQTVAYLGGSTRFQGFYSGEVALKDVVYFLTLIVGALFLAVRVLESRRWR